MSQPKNTNSESYKDYLLKNQNIWWKALLPVQLPYRQKIKNLKLGKTLEIGCGLGRLMPAYSKGSVGVDHNNHFVDHCNKQGWEAYTTETFKQMEASMIQPAIKNFFDSLVLAHVLEHCTINDSIELIKNYLPFIKLGGKIVVITPQEKGYASDPTHVQYVDFNTMELIFDKLGIRIIHKSSFPFPKWVGKFFRSNEFVTVGKI